MPCLSQWAASQSRTICLSKLAMRSAGVVPDAQAAASQYLDESLVSTSSARVSTPSSSTPNSNLVSARMIPCASAVAAARR